jgi:predicted RND superfamily exporter protein
LVNEIQGELSYCQLLRDQYHITGSSVISAELDKIGGQEANKIFFVMSLVVSLGVLYLFLQNVKAALGFWMITIWSIYATLSGIKICGGEMNFIMGSISVLVMIFTIGMSIQYLGYYQSCKAGPNQTGEALQEGIIPCLFAQLTTIVGLLSLNVSDILPVRQFGIGSAIGCSVATFSGMFLVPAVLINCPAIRNKEAAFERFFQRIGAWSIIRRKQVIWGTCVLTAISLVGMTFIQVILDPLDFLPKNSAVVKDLYHIEDQLTCVDSVELVVDFDGQELGFVQKLQKITGLQQDLAKLEYVRHCMSAASFFPQELPESSRELLAILKKADAKSSQNEYITEGERLWRLSLRIDTREPGKQQQLIKSIQRLSTPDMPITVTGMSSLIKQAQRIIFTGFWESFGTAFLIISVIMGIAVRGGLLSIIAMIPNIVPLLIAYGVLGLLNIPLDIGMMMTGSIAMGVAVDGTFHHMSIWQKFLAKGYSSKGAACRAVWCKSIPMARSTFLSILGMMCLGVSSFKPTACFGLLMASMMFLAFLGDLMLLPALLSYVKFKKKIQYNEEIIPEGSVLKLHSSIDKQSLHEALGKAEIKESIATAS